MGWQSVGWMMLAGAVGTLARYALGTAVQASVSRAVVGQWASFPYGTLVVNVLGCAVFGLVVAVADERLVLDPRTRLILATGFLGAFTTFSTFAYESVALAETMGGWMLVANVLANNLFGLAGVVLGMVIGRNF